MRPIHPSAHYRLKRTYIMHVIKTVLIFHYLARHLKLGEYFWTEIQDLVKKIHKFNLPTVYESFCSKRET